ncbi:MAG: hypothetical protein M3Q45_06235, partial [Chloroflexota bacterium]|nr:hypothetical protein [Chloroflexota bacterium]
LWTVLPQDYTYRSASLDDKKATYAAIVRHKSGALYTAFVAFAIGIIAFAGLVMILLVQR